MIENSSLENITGISSWSDGFATVRQVRQKNGEIIVEFWTNNPEHYQKHTTTTREIADNFETAFIDLVRIGFFPRS